MNTIKKQHRQGDVGVFPVKTIPAGAVKLDVKDRIVLAYGEVTNHAHAITVGDAVSIHELPCQGGFKDCYLRKTGDPRISQLHVHRFLQIDGESVELKHEEHDPHLLAPGYYEVIIQREYSPEAIRNVAD